MMTSRDRLRALVATREQGRQAGLSSEVLAQRQADLLDSWSKQDHAALAQEVLDMLDGQRAYFKDRTPELLEASRAREKALRARCKALLTPPAPPPSPGLFDK